MCLFVCVYYVFFLSLFIMVYLPVYSFSKDRKSVEVGWWGGSRKSQLRENRDQNIFCQ